MRRRDSARLYERGTVSPAEAILLAVMAAVVVAIAVPSYSAMQDRSHDATARAHVRQAVDAVEAFHADRGTYVGVAQPALSLYDPSLGESSYRVEVLDGKGYCVESSSGGRTWHLVGPAGNLAHGACP